MLDAINFVKGAVATKDFIPILTTVYIGKTFTQGQNGVLCIQHPFECENEICVPAKRLTQLLNVVDHSDVKITDKKLIVETDKVKATINAMPPEEFSIQKLPFDSEIFDIDGRTLIDVLKKLRPFVSEDASREWSQAIIIRDGFAYATNNVVIARHVFPVSVEMKIGVMLIDELLRIGKPPMKMLLGENEITFIYENDAWIKSKIPVGEWPEFSHLFEHEPTENFPAELPVEIDRFNFFDEYIQFTEEGVIIGDAIIKGYQLTNKSAYMIKPLLPVFNIIEQYDIVGGFLYFSGKGITGVCANVEI